MKILLTISLSILGYIFAQTSTITIGGTGTSATSAHITVTTDGYKCPSEFIVESGASLTTWDPSAICGASTSGGGDISLPVELADFTAKQIGSAVVLKWRTESEEDNIGFILDRKDDNSDWFCITDYKTNNDLLGNGTCTFANEYEYTDNLVEANTTYYYRLADVSMDGIIQYHNKIEITTEIFENNIVPSQFALYPAYPNPFNPVTTIRFDLPEEGNVKMSIYNEMGKLVKVLVDNNLNAGQHAAQWDSKDRFGEPVSAGVYLYEIKASDYQATNKMILLK